MIDKNQVQSRYVDEWNCNIIMFLIWVVRVGFHGKFEHGTTSLRHVRKQRSFLGY